MRGLKGYTLTELLIASAVGAIVMLGMVTMDAPNMRIYTMLRRQMSYQHSDAAMAMMHIAQNIKRADRIRLFGALGMQLRIPQSPTNLDLAANYRWVQYKYVGATRQLIYYENIPPCTQQTVIANQITAADFLTGLDIAPAPPGGDPAAYAPSDLNQVDYTLTWDNGLTGANQLTHRFDGYGTARAIPYQDMYSNFPDSGRGLTPTNVSPPPPSC